LHGGSGGNGLVEGFSTVLYGIAVCGRVRPVLADFSLALCRLIFGKLHAANGYLLLLPLVYVCRHATTY
jgi:hypothetical protein